MGVWRTLRFLMSHPLTQDERGQALLRFARWQIGSRVLGEPVAMPYVEDNRLLVESGMAGATGNVYAGLHEFEDMAFVLHALRPSSWFLDIGANVGSYTVLAGGGSGAMCISVEPIPATYEKLCDNVRLNDLYRRVSCYNLGVGEERGELRFTKAKGPENRVLQSDTMEEEIRVPITTADKLATEADLTDKVLVAKVDVEGWEAAVIRGGKAIFSRSSPTALLLELDGSGARYGFNDDAIHEELLEKGYISVEYDPHQRQLTRRSQRQTGGNTLYVNEVGFFSQRVEQSDGYSVLGKQI